MMASRFFPTLDPDTVDPDAGPRLMLGAASPLWLMFGGAAMAGASWWWWTNRWRESVNLEAILALAPEPVAPPTLTLVESVAPPAPAPAPAATLFDAPAPEPTPEPALEAADLAPAAVETVVETVEAMNDLAVEAVEAAAKSAEAAADAGQALVEPTTEMVEAVAEAAVATAEAELDDLTRLVGVGPKLAAALAAREITSFAQIAAWGEAELEIIDEALDLKGRAVREAWVDQARRLAEPPTEESPAE